MTGSVMNIEALELPNISLCSVEAIKICFSRRGKQNPESSKKEEKFCCDNKEKWRKISFTLSTAKLCAATSEAAAFLT
jgi:hypothetical protein